jgi:hypothetical protein
MDQARFTRVVHADWSTSPGKRYFVEAWRNGDEWLVDAPQRVGPVDLFVAGLVGGTQPTLAGFDFPIGVPASFGRKTGFGEFIHALQHFGRDSWSGFYDVAERAEDVSYRRPFYPRKPSSSARQSHLLAGLELEDITALRRQCERATSNRRAACPLFWTLGGNQVGKAAISGWLEVVQPARKAGARLWPFDGELVPLAEAGGLVICETYPAEAYAHVGVRFRPGASKRCQNDRREATANLLGRCRAHRVHLTEALEEAFAAGFGCAKAGEDPFDAAVGLLGMIEVVEGRRAAAPASTEAPEWEGWILGQLACGPA